MGRKSQPVFHLKATKFWRSGRLTALRGKTWEAGEYRRRGWFESGRDCPECLRIAKDGSRS